MKNEKKVVSPDVTTMKVTFEGPNGHTAVFNLTIGPELPDGRTRVESEYVMQPERTDLKQILSVLDAPPYLRMVSAFTRNVLRDDRVMSSLFPAGSLLNGELAPEEKTA